MVIKHDLTLTKVVNRSQNPLEQHIHFIDQAKLHMLERGTEFENNEYRIHVHCEPGGADMRGAGMRGCIHHGFSRNNWSDSHNL